MPKINLQVKVTVILCLLMTLVSPVYASNSAGEGGRWTPFEFGTLDLIEPDKPIQIFGTDASVYGLRFSVFYAQSKNITGIDFGPVGYNRVDNNLTGLQVGAGVNRVGGRVRGLQTGGVANIAEDESLGIQFAGGVNYGKELKGIQISGLSNWGFGDSVWLQATGGVNLTANDQDSSSHGIHLAGVGNIYLEESEETDYGLQLGGVFNAHRSRFTGAQFSLLQNGARYMKGVQITGLFNRAVDMRGVQIGLINYTETLQGLQIGAVNVVRNAEKVPVLPVIYASF